MPLDILPHLSLDEMLRAAGGVALALALGGVAHRILFAVLGRLARLSASDADDLALDRIRQPALLLMLALAFALAAPLSPLLEQARELAGPFIIPALVGWIALNLVRAGAIVLERQAQLADDPAALRSRHTRIAIFSRTAAAAIVVVTAGLLLLRIPGVREVGMTLVASAGLAALAVGAAAQPALKSLVAGLQMALTEPVRIGDQVVVDGHTGRVEDIRMSYVVIRTWDERAVVVPTSFFIDRSFENWSRKNEVLSGAVFLYLDPVAKIAAIRKEAERYIATRPEWDGRTASVHMTDAKSDYVELRIAMSSHAISQLFTLRAAVREHMIGWLRDTMPEALIHRTSA